MELNLFPKSQPERVTLNNVSDVLAEDTRVKVAGIDVDGVLRGKMISKKKFLSIAETGFGFISLVFGWDIHDVTYNPALPISNDTQGYRDLLAKVDLATFRRIPWEGNVPFFLLTFYDPETKEPVDACPRSLLRRITGDMDRHGYRAMAGAEYEFYQFKNPGGEPSAGAFLEKNRPEDLSTLDSGNHCYSVTQNVHHRDLYYEIFDKCQAFQCPIESWHPESGPGVYEAALEFTEAGEMADRASLFKFLVRSISSQHGVTPCFMAKPREGQPGNGGHVHVSMVDSQGANLFTREERDAKARWKDIEYLSDFGRHFLAGVLTGLPDLMVLFAPNINSYKRLVSNFWAPVTVSWGYEHRLASIRLITPPSASRKAARMEVRVPGADANASLVLAAILGMGWRGVEQKLDIPCPPLGHDGKPVTAETMGKPLAKSLRAAVQQFARPESMARQIFGDAFVDHYASSREHELRVWEEAVTDWEFKRYLELV